MKWIALVGALGMAAAITALSPAQTLAQAPSIAGAWTINQDESDDLQEVMGPREPGVGIPQARRGAQRSTRGGRRDGRGGRARPSEEQIQVGRVMMQLFREGGQRLAIAHTDSTVTVISGGRSHVYYVDDRKLEAVIVDGVEVEVRAKWDGDKLKVETKGLGSVRVTQEFELDDDTGRLKVETKLSNSRMDQNFTLERVYDPARRLTHP